MDFGILPRGKDSPATENRELDLYANSATAAKPPPETQITPPPREGRVGRDFTRDPNLLSSTTRSAAEKSLVSDTTCQALDGDPTRTNIDSQETQSNSRTERNLVKDRELLYCSLYEYFAWRAIQIDDTQRRLQPSLFIGADSSNCN
jgi:hypothetical protein